MDKKNVICKKCNTGGLFWRQSAKGNWYLCDPAPVLTSHMGNKMIPFAHKCPMKYDEQGNYVIDVRMHPDEIKRLLDEAKANNK